MIALLLVGCGGPEQSAAWMEGAGFTWQYFNHRVSHLELGVDDDGAFAGIVGGTSTTAVQTELGPECDPDTCQEFPFVDLADVTLGFAEVTTREAVFGTASADLVVDAAGGAVTLEIPLPTRARGDVTPILRGWLFDTDLPLVGDPACYRPRNGWLPSELSLALEDASLAEDGRSVTVQVRASFVTGPSLEEERVCLDAVIDRAQITVRADVLAVVSKAPSRTVPVTTGATYAYGTRFDPEPQDPPAPVGIDGPLDEAVVGWTAWTFRFHGQDPRGAYLRTLALPIDAGAAEVNAVATNFSPGTQLSAFDYDFDGTLGIVEIGDAVRREARTITLDELVDDAANPVVTRF